LKITFWRRKDWHDRDDGKIDAGAMHLAAMRACGLLKVLANLDRMMLMCQLS
jgi:hypothetical protein